MNLGNQISKHKTKIWNATWYGDEHYNKIPSKLWTILHPMWFRIDESFGIGINEIR